ncbi:hypothetical protein RPJ47_13800, partial [Salmonella enterica]|uniref:hypothetical protein n=1 Tax=Salmonella enterica TaxID=28901 RepID=UPI002B0139C9|nr:hypothetical protein [Salmonella enterica]
IFSCVVRRLRFSGPKTSIICSPMTSLKTSIKTITYLSDIGCLEIQGASLGGHSCRRVTFTADLLFIVTDDIYLLIIWAPFIENKDPTL